MKPAYLVHHLFSARQGNLVDILLQQIGMETPLAHELLTRGSIWVNGVRAREDRSVEMGEYLRVHAEPRRFPVDEIDWKSRVIAEDEDYVVLNKPSGIPVHATVDNWVENCLYSLEQTLGCPFYITQRLDTPTSGLIVYAKTKWFQAQFNKQLRERRVHKIYQALVEKPVALGEMIHFMEDTAHAPRILALEAGPNRMECRLIVHGSEPTLQGHLLRIELLTGRTHQIRSQLAFEGAPILGDKAYGSTQENPWPKTRLLPAESIALRSSELRFWNPKLQKELEFCLPSDPLFPTF